MRKKNYLPLLLASSIFLLSYTTSEMMYNPNCPTGYTGAPSYSSASVKKCTSCHSSGLTGGSVTVTGLPSGNYVPGQTYNFSVTITHSSANRNNWGFAIKAVSNTDRSVVGTFSSSNSNASTKSSGNTLELSHATAAVSVTASSYTYSNLQWTAPSSPTTNQNSVRFYFTGVAGNGNNSSSGDYTYNGVQDAVAATLPVRISSFNLAIGSGGKSVDLNWQTQLEEPGESFEIEAGTDAIHWSSRTTVQARTMNGGNQYAYTDHNPLSPTGTNYYRIRMNEIDGSFHYSETKAIRLSGSGFHVRASGKDGGSGNPAVPAFIVESGVNRSMNLNFYDATGNLLGRKTVVILAGTNTMKFPEITARGFSGLLITRFIGAGVNETVRQMIGE